MRCHKAEKWFLRSSTASWMRSGWLSSRSTFGLARPAPGWRKSTRPCSTSSKRDEGRAPPLFLGAAEVQVRPGEKIVRPRPLEALVLKAIPVFLGVVLAFGAGLVFFAPPDQTPMTQSELLLMRDQAPMSDVQSIFEERQGEDRNMQLIFAAADEREPVRRPIP